MSNKFIKERAEYSMKMNVFLLRVFILFVIGFFGAWGFVQIGYKLYDYIYPMPNISY